MLIFPPPPPSPLLNFKMAALYNLSGGWQISISRNVGKHNCWTWSYSSYEIGVGFSITEPRTDRNGGF